MVGFREAVRSWANQPTRAERREKERLKEIQIQKAADESAQVRALKKQLQVMEELLDKAYSQIQAQSDIIANHKQGDWMDKLVDKGIDLADNLFGGKPAPRNITPPQAIESRTSNGNESSNPNLENEVLDPYTSEEVQELVKGFDFEQIKMASKAPYGMFSSKLKQHYPRATKENILEAYNLVLDRVESGK
jgi:hypothetical protein